MKSIFLFFVVVWFAFLSVANAALIDNGNETITDADTNLMWIQNADVSGTMTWDEAMGWADTLVYADYDDWRLPYSDTTCSGGGCTESEMGHLFYVESITATSQGPFSNVKSYMYWSGDEDGDDAWRFSFNFGTQGLSDKDSTRYAWAVRKDVPVISEPTSLILFLVGGSMLAFRRFIKA